MSEEVPFCQDPKETSVGDQLTDDDSLYPTPAEIMNFENDVPEDTVPDSYTDVAHYLDVHSSVLRKQFFSSFTSNAKKFLQNSDTVETTNPHHRVKFLRPQQINGTPGFLLQMKQKGQQNFNFKNKYEFVCFTKDKFNTVSYGNLYVNNEKYIVEIVSGKKNISLDTDYLMMQTKAYVDIYKHLVSALSELNANNLPLKEYLVYGNQTAECPDYYKESSKLDTTGINSLQLEAYKNALSRKFTIIKGLPGTGKTYLSSRIAKTLIENKADLYRDSPLLVVSYTNHALDVFLQELIKTTKSIVRMSTIAPNNELAAYKMSRIRQKIANDQKENGLEQQKKCIKCARDTINKVDAYFNRIYNCSGTIDVDSFLEDFPEFTNGSEGNIKLERWLMEKSLNEKHPKQLPFASKKEQENRDFEDRNQKYQVDTDLTTHVEINLEKLKANPNQFEKALREKLEHLKRDHDDLNREYVESTMNWETEIMKEHMVIAMTTTVAARLRNALLSLKCPIVIVLDAAEILEAHIIVSLTEYCQQLILVGDELCTVDKNVKRKVPAKLTLFGRIPKNSIHWSFLDVQYRMRPEISKFISVMYPNVILKNDPSVKKFQKEIKGTNSCLYCITHTNPEQGETINSPYNEHEAQFLLQFAKYLIENGYEPKDILILTLYTRQVITLQSGLEEMKLSQEVRIENLDSFDGRMSEIILLSLVRSNNAEQIGYLAIENRVCMALSRASVGLYMIGNMDLLSRNSQIWLKVKEFLTNEKAIGISLALQCPHDVIKDVQTAEDFTKVFECDCNQ